jgi:hypothetical protein
MAPPAYNVSAFSYDPQSHSYTCLQGNILTTNGTWYSKERKSETRKIATPVYVKHFKAPRRQDCRVPDLCTKNTRGRGQVIERTQHQDYIDLDKRNVEQKEHLYKRRQAIIEHTYGTIKRHWNFHHIITKKGIDRAAADVGFMFIAYNLHRIFNLVGREALKKNLRML